MNTTLGVSLNEVGVDLGTLVEGTFLTRSNRFRVEVRVGRQVTSAHLANPGRLEELLIPNRTVWLKRADRPHRKTDYDLVLVEYGEILVSLNAHLPNALLAQALRGGCLPWIDRDVVVRPEAHFGASRLDFLLLGEDNRQRWIEAKSVTLVEGHLAKFPDAPTRRGRRHIHELISAVHQGDQASVIFVVQRSDAKCFTPNGRTDPDFGDALRAAAEVGVQIRAIRCKVTPNRIGLDRTIPVSLDRPTRYGYNPSQSHS
ncbi:MAG: DNA/RNA nuclease SfsA [Anaerolineae bacterium]|nr:DNA/RNA nuclease SfsA [Anaerolineae bacterium]